MKRKHKQYSKPKTPFDNERIKEEAEIKKEFGLKNKKEIWKAEAKINSFRERSKKLVSAKPEEQKILFDKLNKIGFNVNSIADVLSLESRDYLSRRLQTFISIKKIANTPTHARQLITHKKVLVNGKVIDRPSYIVPVEFENKITLKPAKIKAKKEEKKEEPIEKPAEEKAEEPVNENKEEGTKNG